jgi:hypothetical protein
MQPRTIFTLLFLIFALNAQHIIQTPYQNENCSPSNKGIQGIAVISFPLKKKFQEGKCVSMGPFPMIHSALNSSHFETKTACDQTCETCRGSHVQGFGCIKYPGTPFSIGFSFGNLPEIKPNGFIVRIHNTIDCSTNNGVLSFFTDRLCQNTQSRGNFFQSILKMDKKARSSFVNYNVELKQAEVITFDSADCSGNVVEKEVFPLGKCVRTGPGGQSIIQIEKP